MGCMFLHPAAVTSRAVWLLTALIISAQLSTHTTALSLKATTEQPVIHTGSQNLASNHEAHHQHHTLASASSSAGQAQASRQLASTSTGSGTQNIDIRISNYWQEILAICPDLAYKSCEDVDRSLWTDVEQTQVTDFEFNGLGRWSTFKLVTFSHHRRLRTKGGDSWHVLLRDRRQRIKVATRVFDEGNGNYTVAAIIHKAGIYVMGAWLWYSDCNGYQEPMVPFYELEASLTKAKHCYIGHTVRRPVFQGATAYPGPQDRQLCAGCAARTAASDSLLHKLWRTEWYLHRQQNTIETLQCCRPAGSPTPASGLPKRFIMYGDSTIKNSWEVLLYPARRPCIPPRMPRLEHERLRDTLACRAVSSVEEVDPEMDKVLKRCTGGLPWTTVPVGVNQKDLLQHYPMAQYFNVSDFRYNDTFYRTHVPPVTAPMTQEFTAIYSDGWGCRILPVVLPDLEAVQSRDVLLLNIGAHCQRTYRFEQWRQYMDELAERLKAIIAATGVPIIWRSTFVIEENVLRSHPEHLGLNGYLASAHFNTDARRILFDSYAEHVLLKAGVYLWDVYGASAIGDNKPHDMFHADLATFWAMTKDMMDLFVCKPIPPVQ